MDTDTGELQERRLQHREEAAKFYGDLAAHGMKVRVGMEASSPGDDTQYAEQSACLVVRAGGEEQRVPWAG